MSAKVLPFRTKAERELIAKIEDDQLALALKLCITPEQLDRMTLPPQPKEIKDDV